MTSLYLARSIQAFDDLIEKYNTIHKVEHLQQCQSVVNNYIVKIKRYFDQIQEFYKGKVVHPKAELKLSSLTSLIGQCQQQCNHLSSPKAIPSKYKVKYKQQTYTLYMWNYLYSDIKHEYFPFLLSDKALVSSTDSATIVLGYKANTDEKIYKYIEICQSGIIKFSVKVLRGLKLSNLELAKSYYRLAAAGCTRCSAHEVLQLKLPFTICKDLYSQLCRNGYMKASIQDMLTLCNNSTSWAYEYPRLCKLGCLTASVSDLLLLNIDDDIYRSITYFQLCRYGCLQPSFQDMQILNIDYTRMSVFGYTDIYKQIQHEKFQETFKHEQDYLEIY